MSISGIFKAYKSRFILIFIIVTIATVIDAGTQYLMTPAFNNLRDLNFQGFLFFTALSLSGDLVRIFLVAAFDYLFSRQSQTYLQQIRERMSRYFFKKEIIDTAQIQNQMSANLDQLTENYLKPLKGAYMYALEVLLSIGILFSFHWSLVVLTLIFTVISLFLPKTFAKMTANARVNLTQKNKSLLEAISKWVSGLDELRRYASFDIFTTSLDKNARQYQKASVKQLGTVEIAHVLTSLVNIGGQIFLLLLCTYLYFQGQIVFGAVITTIQFSSTVMNGVAEFVQELNLIKSAAGVKQEVGQLQKPVKISSNRHATQQIASLRVKDLALEFKNGEKITYPDFQVKKGEKVILLGDSGTGKSTLFKLILGKLKASHGQITFCNQKGQPLRFNLDELGYLAQDGTLFPGSIKNNITMFNAKLEKDIPRVVRAVGLEKDLARFPQGAESIIDLDQDNLSGGQKQKILLARALIHQPKWLLIDEGTSAIDQQTTKQILEQMLKMPLTIIMIAHNFSADLIKQFDKQVLLKGGGDR